MLFGKRQSVVSTERTEPPTPETNRWTVDRLDRGGTRVTKPLPPLAKEDCCEQWKDVKPLLEGLMIVKEGRAVAPSMLGKQAIGNIAKAIVILVDADRLMAACTLIRVCEPSVRLELLRLCGSERVERLRSSKVRKVRNSMNRALDAAAHDALTNKRFHEFFGLLPSCSSATRKSVAAFFPQLTVELLNQLEDDELVEAVRLTLERGRELGTAKCLVEIHMLLSVAVELKTTEPQAPNLSRAVTMISMTCSALDELPLGADERELAEYAAKLSDMTQLPELTRDLVDGCPATVRSEVLCVAVEQAAAEQDSRVCANRLLGLAELSDEIDESDGIALRSHLMLVGGWLVVRLSDQLYEAHTSSLQSILMERDATAKRRFSILTKSKTSQAIGKLANALIDLADRFRSAVETGDLYAAALAIRECPYPELCNTARRRLAEAVREKLAAAGDKRDVVALRMAVVLVATGDAECSRLAATILSIVFRRVEHQRFAVQQMMGGVAREQGDIDDIVVRMVDALRRLCSDEHSLELDVILMMDQGRRLAAQIVVDCLRLGKSNNPTLISLFNELAHRVDLGVALPAITVRFEDGGKGPIEEVLEEAPLATFKQIATWRNYTDLSDYQIQHVHPWARGWRLMWVMLDMNTAFSGDPMLLMGLKAIDAAAADGLRGGADELLHRLKYPWAQRALDAMLESQVNGTPLLSDQALHNVLRAMLSDEQLGSDTFEWIENLDPTRSVKLFAAAAHALISLAGDSSPCRFYPDRLANHAVGAMVRKFNVHLRLLHVREAVEAKMGKSAWREISSKFPPGRRTGMGLGPG